MLRQRRTDNNNHGEEGEELVEPQDEQDQATVIADLEKKMLRQDAEIHFMYVVLCIACAILVLIVTLFVDWHFTRPFVNPDDHPVRLRLLRAVQGVCSAALYLLTAPLLKAPWNELKVKLFLPCVLYLGISTITFTQGEPITAYFAVGLFFGNVFLLAGAAYLRQDSESTLDALEELRAAKYNHKRL